MSSTAAGQAATPSPARTPNAAQCLPESVI
jgi:hypothetical protein